MCVYVSVCVCMNVCMYVCMYMRSVGQYIPSPGQSRKLQHILKRGRAEQPMGERVRTSILLGVQSDLHVPAKSTGSN